MTPKINLPEGMTAGTLQHWQQLGSITAEAFYDDPVNRWIFGTTAAMDAAFPILARALYLKHGVCHMIGDQAATMWLPFGAPSGLPILSTLQLAWAISQRGSKGCVGRAIEAGERMTANHPTEPHLYLFALGTRKAARGIGLGKAILAPVLAACDASNTAIYLENSNPNNHGFYVSRGFETMDYFACGKDNSNGPAPTLEKMWRAPRND